MQGSRPKTRMTQAIIFILLASLFTTIMIVFVKLAAATQPTQVILFARYLITFILILPFIYYNKSQEPVLHYLKTNNIKLHLFRDSCGLISLFCYFYTAKETSLATATVLFNTAPLFIPLIAYFWGGLKIMHRLWWGMGLGFIGVILIVHPSKESLFNLSAFIGLLSGFFAALVFVGTRYLIYSEPPLRNMFYYFLVGTVVTAVIMLFSRNLPPLTMNTCLFLFAVGVFGYLYQYCFTYAAQNAPVRLTSTFMYTSVIFSIFFDWLIWQIKPSLISILGILCIILGGCLLVLLFPKNDYQKH